MVASEAAKESHRGSYDVMVGNREKRWLPVYFYITDEFAIILSRKDIVDTFFLPRAVEGTCLTEQDHD